MHNRRALLVSCMLIGGGILLSVGNFNLNGGLGAMAQTEKTYLLGKKTDGDFTAIASLAFDETNAPHLTLVDGAEGGPALQAALDEITAKDVLLVDGRREKVLDSGETVIQLIKSRVSKTDEGYSSAVRQMLSLDYGYTVVHR